MTQMAPGVSGEVRFVETPDGPIVLKTALGKLKVAADWFCSPERNAREAECLRVLASVLGPDSVPEVLWVDEATHTFAMRRLPERLGNWKTRLLACDVDHRTAGRVGELLGQMHTRTSGRADLATRFEDRTYFFDLRVTPYHRKVMQRLPELAPHIEQVVQRMLDDRLCLVHGDYSPKNLLTDGADVVMLDCEVAHWGDPRFDIAFCLTHLLLKTLHSAGCADQLAATARAYLQAYANHGLPVLDAELTRATGCLVLARVVGDSPVEYLTTEQLRQAALALGKQLLVEPDRPETCVERALALRG